MQEITMVVSAEGGAMGPTRDETTLSVSETVSSFRETPVEELPPLATMIDVDALDTLIPSDGDGQTTDVTVSFQYAGVRVVVRSGNVVDVEPIESEREIS